MCSKIIRLIAYFEECFCNWFLKIKLFCEVHCFWTGVVYYSRELVCEMIQDILYVAIFFTFSKIVLTKHSWVLMVNVRKRFMKQIWYGDVFNFKHEYERLIKILWIFRIFSFSIFSVAQLTVPLSVILIACLCLEAMWRYNITFLHKFLYRITIKSMKSLFFKKNLTKKSMKISTSYPKPKVGKMALLLIIFDK